MDGSSSSRRKSNMTGFEDEILCQSYAKITVNPIVGNNQPGVTFWRHIESEYNSNPNIQVSRTATSLQSRFSTISAQVMLYASKIAHAYNNYQSGTNELNWIDRARADFQQANHNKPFLFDGCYQILKDLPKYNVMNTMNNTMNRPQPLPTQPVSTQESNETSSPTTPTTPISNLNLSSDASPDDIEGPSQRPGGRKGEKQRQKRKARSTMLASSNAMLENCEKFTDKYVENMEQNRTARARFASQMDDLLQLRKTEMEMKENEIKMRESEMKMKEAEMEWRNRKEEDAIMATDTSNMSPANQEYYRMRVNEIIQKRFRRNNNFPGGSDSHM